MASKEQYAQWIVTNQSKKGTPEFETVAAAYKAAGASATPQTPAAQSGAIGMPQQQPTDQNVSIFVNSLLGGRGYNPEDPSFGMSGPQRFAAGAGKMMTDMYEGARQIGGVDNQAEIEEKRERDAPLMGRGAAQAGSMTGAVATALPLMLVPGANTYAGAALTGAAMGALNPTIEGESRTENAAMGAVGGVLGRGVVNGASRMLSPRTSAAAREMLDDDIPLTPGQIMGGGARRVEEGAKSIPLVGDGIRAAERRGIEGFNKAALNRVLKPIGAKTDSIGNDGVQQARALVSDAYDDALNSLKRVDIDSTFDTELTQVRSMVRALPKNIREQFEGVIEMQLEEKLTPSRTMAAQQFKSVVSELDRLGRGYSGPTNSFDQNQLGDAILQVRSSLMSLAGRIDPAAKAALSKADTAYAQLLRVENAASRAQEGIFTPTQLSQAARMMDRSSRKVATAQGRALMQDFAQSGRNVLSSELPNSGTVDRALLTGGAYLINPALAGGMIAGRAAYKPAVQSALSKLLTQRPDAARLVGDNISRLALPAAVTGAAITTQGK